MEILVGFGILRDERIELRCRIKDVNMNKNWRSFSDGIRFVNQHENQQSWMQIVVVEEVADSVVEI